MTSATGASGQASDNTASTQGQASQVNNSGTSSAASQGQASGDNTAASTASSGASQADYDRMIAELRKENAAHRTKLKAFEDAQAAADAAKLSDLEKASKRAEAAEASIQTLRQRIAASELKVAAQAAGIIDHDVAAALLSGKVEYDAAGEPTNIGDLVTALKKDKPHLFGNVGANGANGQRAGQQQQQPSSGGATNAGRAAGNGGLTLEMIRAMPMRERVARMDEIKAWEKAQAQATK